MKAYKIEILVVDHEDYGAESIATAVENAKYLNAQVMSVTESEIGEWDDDHPLNNRDEAPKEFKRLFPPT